ncbi:unnamed protein product, partial [Closterium sp. NIES-53]
ASESASPRPLSPHRLLLSHRSSHPPARPPRSLPRPQPPRRQTSPPPPVPLLTLPPIPPMQAPKPCLPIPFLISLPVPLPIPLPIPSPFPTPPGFDALQNLQVLDLSHNHIAFSSAIAPLTHLPALRALSLAHNLLGAKPVDRHRYCHPSPRCNRVPSWVTPRHSTGEEVS